MRKLNTVGLMVIAEIALGCLDGFVLFAILAVVSLPELHLKAQIALCLAQCSNWVGLKVNLSGEQTDFVCYGVECGNVADLFITFVIVVCKQIRGANLAQC